MGGGGGGGGGGGCTTGRAGGCRESEIKKGRVRTQPRCAEGEERS